MSRIFVALTLPEPMQQSVLFWRQNYTHLPVRWVVEKNLHITIVPPWQEHDFNKAVVKLQSISINKIPFTLKFDTVSLGPQPHSPRLIWASGVAPSSLLRLKQNIETALGVAPQPRPFKLHLTLARFRPEEYASFPFPTLNETIDWRDQIDSFVLMESRLSLQGSDYKVLDRFLL